MNWKLRHEGSPKLIGENLSYTRVLKALAEGEVDPSDEVCAMGESRWRPLEDHPDFAEPVSEMEPPAAPSAEGDSHLDMNALIDVTLVLLIFFILTASYQVLERVLSMPDGQAQSAGGPVQISRDAAKLTMIFVTARQENGKPTLAVDGSPLSWGELKSTLRKLGQDKHQMLLDVAGVEYGTIVAIVDAAAGAKIDKVNFLVSEGK
jgi:biopolymer transport protein ExbD